MYGVQTSRHAWATVLVFSFLTQFKPQEEGNFLVDVDILKSLDIILLNSQAWVV